MVETLLLIIMASGIGIYHDTNKPTEYELNMEDGSNTHIVLQKNSQYACPLYCEVDHIHHAVLYKDEKRIDENKSVIIYLKRMKVVFLFTVQQRKFFL